ncbi:hypothetical protein [Streptomyces sp. NPDC018972]|uniref:hypothetical protein n=1 Tax=Streptomyces sp. NPDC018972 TaxID=3365060 RepID=UPI0037BD416E
MLDAVAAVELEGPPSVVEASAKCAEHVGMWFLQTRNRSHYDEGLRNLEERRAAEEQLADSSPRPATEALTALSAYQEWWLHGRRYDSDRMARGVALMTEFSDAVRDLEEVRSEAVTQIVARAALGALGSTGDRSDLDRLSERRIEFRRLRQVFLEAAHLALAPREYDGGGMV